MKKIMFNDKFLLTQAVLEGRKTQIRRVITYPKTFHGKDVCGYYVCRRATDRAITEVCMYDENESFIDEGQILPKYKVSNVARQLREMTKKLSSPIYGLEDAALACGNSDFIKECVTLIATRCGDDGESKQKLIAAIREATA